MSSVFGTGVPVFTGSGTPDSTTITLFYSTLQPSFSEKVMKMFESPVSADGVRTFKNKGRHATFTVIVNLYKYDLTPKASADAWTQSAKAMAAKLLTYENQNMTFYPFASPGYSLQCHLVDINFSFLENVGSVHDVCALTFKTTQFYDLSSLVIP